MAQILYMNHATDEAEQERVRIDSLNGVLLKKDELDRLDPELRRRVVLNALAQPDVRLVWSFLADVLGISRPRP